MAKFSVMTANVAGQVWMGFKHRKGAAREIFGKLAPDLVGFQELGLSNWDEVFGPARPDLQIVHGKPCGDIIINSFAYNPSKFDLIVSDTVWLSPDGSCKKAWDGCERGMTWGQLRERASRREFLFINTHLDNVGYVARRESIGIILKWMRAFEGLPAILTADSNVSIDSPWQTLWGRAEMRMPYTMMVEAGFADSWKAVHTEGPRPYTYHGGKGCHYNVLRDDRFGTYDTEWIMVHGPVKTVEARLIRDEVNHVYPSDHFWMEVVLDWK